MLWKMFTVYDSKAEVYLPPFCFKAKGEALRAFTGSANQPDHPVANHPGDYTLFEIGAYDDSTGFSAPLEHHINLGKAIEFIVVPSSVPIVPSAEKLEV